VGPRGVAQHYSETGWLRLWGGGLQQQRVQGLERQRAQGQEQQDGQAQGQQGLVPPPPPQQQQHHERLRHKGKQQERQHVQPLEVGSERQQPHPNWEQQHHQQCRQRPDPTTAPAAATLAEEKTEKLEFNSGGGGGRSGSRSCTATSAVRLMRVEYELYDSPGSHLQRHPLLGASLDRLLFLRLSAHLRPRPRPCYGLHAGHVAGGRPPHHIPPLLQQRTPPATPT
ncbi:hypothetical protein Agub_g8017, partial [Astrephomene gubernaculifera]